LARLRGGREILMDEVAKIAKVSGSSGDAPVVALRMNSSTAAAGAEDDVTVPSVALVGGTMSTVGGGRRSALRSHLRAR
jgi:hypothetical protein